MDNTNILNLLALEFNKSAQMRMNELCCPLHQYGIYMFNFVRTYYDGKRIYLSTDSRWVEHYLTNNFQDNLEHMAYYLAPPDIKYSFWISFKRDDIFESLYEYGIDHGFTIFEHHPHHVDQFGFSTYRNKSTLQDFYAKNIHIFEDFIKDFKVKAADLIPLKEEKKLIIPSKKFKAETLRSSPLILPDKIDHFMEVITKKHV